MVDFKKNAHHATCRPPPLHRWVGAKTANNNGGFEKWWRDDKQGKASKVQQIAGGGKVEIARKGRFSGCPLSGWIRPRLPMGQRRREEGGMDCAGMGWDGMRRGQGRASHSWHPPCMGPSCSARLPSGSGTARGRPGLWGGAGRGVLRKQPLREVGGAGSLQRWGTGVEGESTDPPTHPEKEGQGTKPSVAESHVL